MPGITNPAEEYFKDGVWAWDPAGAEWLKLIIDPLTNRLVIDHPGDLEVVQPTPADLCVANHGWDGAAWRKLPLVWGYSGVYAEYEFEADVAAGDVTLSFTQVAAGQIWVITHISAHCSTANPTHVQFQPVIDGNYRVVSYQPLAVAFVTVELKGPFYLRAADKVTVKFVSCAVNDDVYAYAVGYKMKIAE